jgi:ribosomal-protein-alanine N-acetyltransferase
VAEWHWPHRPGEPGGPRTRDETRAILEQNAARCAQDDFGLWWWRERASGKLVGEAGLNREQIEGEPVVEVGWSMSPERWGEGFATEAGKAALDWGFERIGLRRIVSFTMPHNAASRRVMEKLGLRYEREFDRAGVTQVLYAIERQSL